MSTTKSTETTESTEEQTTEQSTEEQASTEEQTSEEQSTEEASEETTDDDAGESTDDGGDELPAWAREKLTKTNAEAANYRTKLREAENKLKEAKTTAEVEEIVNQMQKDRVEAERALLIENVALAHKLPKALQKRLTGTTREELEADAKELSALFSVEDDEDDEHLEGGLSPRQRGDSPQNPRDLAATFGHRRKR